MPRMARKKSRTGIYHIILRGTNRQVIFHDDEDNLRFLETLKRYKVEVEIKTLGWCLMSNHVHLLIEEGKEDIAVTMKRIEVSFAWYYNWKYRTTGHLFQDRYRSENIENDEYLMTVIRYIHQNPVKAGVVAQPSDWKWSSCKEYYDVEYYPTILVDSSFILRLFSDDRITAVKRFIEFNEMQNEDSFLDDSKVKRLTDEEARVEMIKLITGIRITEIKNLSKTQRDDMVKKAKGIKGVSQRQIARILGISQALVSNT